MKVELPADALVVLIGPSGCGKSTFARRHFAPTAILSSDAFRAMVADDENNQSATEAAFELLHTALGFRMARGRLTVIDATNVEGWARLRLVAVARRYRRPASAIVFTEPVETCLERNAGRKDRRLPEAAIRRQHRRMGKSLDQLEGEGFSQVWCLDGSDGVEVSLEA